MQSHMLIGIVSSFIAILVMAIMYAKATKVEEACRKVLASVYWSGSSWHASVPLKTTSP